MRLFPQDGNLAFRADCADAHAGAWHARDTMRDRALEPLNLEISSLGRDLRRDIAKDGEVWIDDSPS